MMFSRKQRRIQRVLVVEDEPLIAFDTEHLLLEAGYQVVATVDEVDAAIAVIDRQPLDLVIADVRLSAGGTGVDVARSAHGRGVPVLFVSGFCPVDAQKFAIGCLAKPYRQRDLIDSIALIDARLRGQRGRRVPPNVQLYESAFPVEKP